MNVDDIQFGCEKQCTKDYIVTCLGKINEEQDLLDTAVHGVYASQQKLKAKFEIMETMYREGKSYQEYLNAIKEIECENNRARVRSRKRTEGSGDPKED